MKPSSSQVGAGEMHSQCANSYKVARQHPIRSGSLSTWHRVQAGRAIGRTSWPQPKLAARVHHRTLTCTHCYRGPLGSNESAASNRAPSHELSKHTCTGLGTPLPTQRGWASHRQRTSHCRAAYRSRTMDRDASDGRSLTGLRRQHQLHDRPDQQQRSDNPAPAPSHEPIAVIHCAMQTAQRTQ